MIFKNLPAPLKPCMNSGEWKRSQSTFTSQSKRSLGISSSCMPWDPRGGSPVNGGLNGVIWVHTTHSSERVGDLDGFLNLTDPHGPTALRLELQDASPAMWYALVAVLRFPSAAAARTAAEGWTTEDGRPLGCWGGVLAGWGAMVRA